MKTKSKSTSLPPGTDQSGGRVETVFDGLGVSAGIAIGPAHVIERGLVDVPEYSLEEDQIQSELARFADAVEQSTKQVRGLHGDRKSVV